MALEARKKAAIWLAQQYPFEHVQWDELISFEHTRFKPLSIAVMSVERHRCIIEFGVAQVPANGLIAKRSRENTAQGET